MATQPAAGAAELAARPATTRRPAAGSAAIGAAIGRELRFEELPPEAFRRAAVAYLPAGAVDDLLRYLAGYAGRTAEMSADLEKITGLPGMTFAAWAADRADSFR